MDLSNSYHALTTAILSGTGMSDKMMHVNIGLAVYIMGQILLRDRRGSVLALKVLITLEVLNELLDRLYFGSWRWSDTGTDILATLFWPVTIVLVSRYRRRRWERRLAVADLLMHNRHSSRRSAAAF